MNPLFKLNGTERIIDIEYLNPFNLKEYSEDKLSILDIKVKTESGEGKEDIFERIKERSEIKMAVEMLKKISSDEIMRQKYLEREKARLDYK